MSERASPPEPTTTPTTRRGFPPVPRLTTRTRHGHPSLPRTRDPHPPPAGARTPRAPTRHRHYTRRDGVAVSPAAAADWDGDRYSATLLYYPARKGPAPRFLTHFLPSPPLITRSFLVVSSSSLFFSVNRKIHPILRSWVTAGLSNTVSHRANHPKKKASFQKSRGSLVGFSLSEFGGGGRRSRSP